MTKLARRLMAMALLSMCSFTRGSHREEPNYRSNCHRKALLQFFDDLQDSAHTRDDGDLANFIRHFCKTKYTEVPPCELDENVKELQPVSSREFKHLYAALRQFVCEGELHTWQGLKRTFAGEKRNNCWRAFAALGNWSLPRAALCNEIERSTRSCSRYNDAETKVLTLAATAMRALNCTVRAGEDVRYLQTEVSSKHHRTTCQYRRAMNCLTDFATIYTSKVMTVAKKKQVLKRKIVDDICKRPPGTCASTHSTEDCGLSQKNVVTRFEEAQSSSLAVVCRGDAAFLMNMSRTLHCLELLKLNDCLNPNGMLSAVAIFGVSHTSDQCRTIESKALGCVDRALLSPDACGERPDVDGMRDLVHAFLASADCSRQHRSDTIRPLPGPTLFASGAIVVTVALIRRI